MSCNDMSLRYRYLSGNLWYLQHTLQWHHNERDGVSNHQPQPFIQAQIKENTKAPRHWPFCGEFTGDWWIPLTKLKASNTEKFPSDNVIMNCVGDTRVYHSDSDMVPVQWSGHHYSNGRHGDITSWSLVTSPWQPVQHCGENTGALSSESSVCIWAVPNNNFQARLANIRRCYSDARICSFTIRHLTLSCGIIG